MFLELRFLLFVSDHRHHHERGPSLNLEIPKFRGPQRQIKPNGCGTLSKIIDAPLND